MFHYMLHASLKNIMQQTVNLLIKKSVLHIKKKKIRIFYLLFKINDLAIITKNKR